MSTVPEGTDNGPIPAYCRLQFPEGETTAEEWESWRNGINSMAQAISQYAEANGEDPHTMELNVTNGARDMLFVLTPKP